MINDSERREIAARLRITKAECESRDYPWMVEDLLQALGVKRYEDAEDGIFERLADLIDRPTCKNIGGEDGTNGEYYDFFCSVCGFASGVTDPKYCPNCGAEVVR